MSHPHHSSSSHRHRHSRRTHTHTHAAPPPQHPPQPAYEAYANEGAGYDSGYAEGGYYANAQDFSYYPFDDDPNCAICDAPAKTRCSCEFDSLVVAVQQSEERVLRPLWEDIRRWTTYQSKAAIQRDFNARRSFRENAYNDYMHENSLYLSPEQHYKLNRELRKQIDQDWRDAVSRYPEVLDMYYSLVMDAMRNGRGVENLIYAQKEERRGSRDVPLTASSREKEREREVHVKNSSERRERRRRTTTAKERRYE